NLFPSAAEPLRVDPLRTEQPLIVADLPPTHAEVHSVTSIVGMRPGHGSRRPIRPFFAHERERGAPSYVLRRRPAVVDHGIDTFLALSTPRDAAPLDGQEVLSIEVLASNRDLANDLGPGDLTQPTAGSPTGTRFTNITRVSKPVR